MEKMVDSDQKELSDYVKQVHLSLRYKSKEVGAEKAWEEHLKNENVLRKYAFSMKKLAEFWSAKNQTQNEKLCRIQWITDYIVAYFQTEMWENELQKELNKTQMFLKKGLLLLHEELEKDFSCAHQPPFKLLDVGSCYNPLKKFDFLDVYPIDLFPANPEVKKCNFVETSVVNVKENWFCDDLKQLPANFFDIVVFSLYLEYLPSPKQRYWSCVNAYECLKTNGLLLIVTPDSKHATANSVIMKSWKIAAAKIGFNRTRLEKLRYLHCMAFRKSVSRKYPLLLYSIKDNEYDFEEMFIIPQDSVDYKLTEKPFKKSETEEKEMKELFKELPCL